MTRVAATGASVSHRGSAKEKKDKGKSGSKYARSNLPEYNRCLPESNCTFLCLMNVLQPQKVAQLLTEITRPMNWSTLVRVDLRFVLKTSMSINSKPYPTR